MGHVSFREGMSLVKILRLTHSLHRAQVFFTFVGSFAEKSFRGGGSCCLK